jgi:thymidine kinase
LCSEYSYSQKIFIDEAQFFLDLKDTCLNIIKNNKDIYIAALDCDKNQNLWPSINDIMPFCTYKKFSTVCSIDNCPNRACNTIYVGIVNELIVIGEKDYKTVCNQHLLY